MMQLFYYINEMEINYNKRNIMENNLLPKIDVYKRQDVVPAWLIWILAFLCGMIAGALWGSIPGILKAYLNINEVITCIMTNWIAANLVTWFIDAREFLKNSEEGGKVGYVKPTAANGVETFDFGLDKIFPGSQVNGGILIACLLYTSRCV